MFKKYLCLVTILLLVFSTNLCSVATAEEANVTVETTEYTTVDLTSFNNSLAYVDKTNYTNAPVENDEDYFRITTNITAGSVNYDHTFALDKDSVEELKVDGLVYSKDGIPFDWNTDGAIGISGKEVEGINGSCQGFHTNHIESATVDIKDGNYSKLNFLAYTRISSTNTTYFTAQPFYVDLVYEDGTVSKNVTLIGDEDLATNSTQEHIAIRHYKTWNTTTSAKTTQKFDAQSTDPQWHTARVGLYTLDLDITKTLKEVRFYNNHNKWSNWRGQMKVLAMTIETNMLDKLNLAISSLPEASEITYKTVASAKTAIDNLDAALEALNKTYSDLTEDEQAKIEAVKAKIAEVNEELISGPEYTTVDLTPFNNSLAYVDKTNYTNAPVENDEDYFRITLTDGNLANYDHTFALDGDSVEELKENGLVYKNGIPFDWNTDGAIGVSGNGGDGVNGSCHEFHSNHIDSATVNIEDGNYSKLNFLAFTRLSSNNTSYFTAQPFYVDLVYEDGTVKENVTLIGDEDLANSDHEQIAIRFYKTWSTTTSAKTTQKFDAQSTDPQWHTARVGVYSLELDITRTLKEVRFYNNHNMWSNWRGQMKVLAMTMAKDSDIVLEEKNFYKTIDIDALGVATSPIYADNDSCTNIVPIKADDYLAWGETSKYKNNFAIDKASLSAYIKDEILTDADGVPFYMPLKKAIAVGGKDSLSATVDLEDSVYSEINFLTASVNGSHGEAVGGDFTVELQYTDGTRSEEKIRLDDNFSTDGDIVCEAKTYLNWDVNPQAINFALSSDTKAKIRKYSVIPQYDKMVDKVIFSNKSGDMYYSYTYRSKILAVTTALTRKQHAKEKAEEKIQLLSNKEELSYSDVMMVDYTKKIINQYATLGGSIEEVNGYDSFEALEAKAEEIKNSNPAEINIYASPDEDGYKALSDARENAVSAKSLFPEASVNVILRGGDYRLSDTLYMYGDDGITYKAYTGEKPVIKGSKLLSADSFEIAQSGSVYDRLPRNSKGKVKQISLFEQGIDIKNLPTAMNLSLYVDGKEQEVSQYPNGEGNFALGGKRATSDSFIPKDEKGLKWSKIESGDSYIGGNLNTDFGIYTKPVLGVDEISGAVKVDTSGMGSLKLDLMKYKIYHLPEELDSPGEWYVDRENGVLYYYPINDLNGKTIEFICNEKPLIQMKNADNITFSDITFAQSGGLAIDALKNGAERCVSNLTVSGCEFFDLQSGINVIMGEYSPLEDYESDGGENIIIKDSNFYNIWGKPLLMYGGKRITLTANNSYVTNNYFYRCGYKGHSYFNVTFDYTVGTTVENNVFHNMRGIAVGFGGNNIKLRYNEVYNVMRNGTDGGAVYSGNSYLLRGNEIAYNYIHDLETLPNEGHGVGNNVGIYLDDGLSGQYVHNNIISDVGIGVLFYGSDNTVENNTIVNSKLTSVSAQVGGAQLSGAMKNDMVKLMESEYKDIWVAEYPKLQDTYEDCSTPKRNILRKNIFDLNPIIASDFSKGATEISKNYTLGMRKNTAFEDPEKGDFRLKSSNTYSWLLPDVLNTSNFDIEKIGLYVNENRVNLQPFSAEEKSFGLLYPKNGEKVNSGLKLEFSWKKSLGADGYELVIYEDSAMQNIVYSEKIGYNNATVDISNLKGTKYYWCVYAQNNSRQLGGRIKSTETYELFIPEISADTSKIEMIDISSMANEKTALWENEKVSSANESEYYGNYIVNKDYIRKYLDPNNCISLFGTKYKFSDLQNEKIAVGNYSSDATIPLGGLSYEKLSLLLNNPSGKTTVTAEIIVNYSDGSSDVFTQDNLEENGTFFIPALGLSGVNNYWVCSLTEYDIKPDKNKKAVSLTLKKADSRENSLNIYAVSCDAAEAVYLSNRDKNNITADIIKTQKNNGLLEILNMESFEISSETTGIFATEKEGNEIFIWEAGTLKPLTEKIKK